jgi:hypothetical protein
LVIGAAHRFTQIAFGGLVAGEVNTINNIWASVTGGQVNTASGPASVSGGVGNTAGGFESVLIGGQNITDNKNNSIAPQPPFP